MGIDKMAFFSIIVPMHNSEEYLETCLGSLREQTFPDFEVLLVDDGSEDQTVKTAMTQAQADLRFKLFQKPENTGVSDARNLGLREATGEWITFLDADDELEPDALEEARKLISEHPQVQMIQSNLIHLEDGKRSIPEGIRLGCFQGEEKIPLLESILSVTYGKKKYGADTHGNCRCAGAKFYQGELIREHHLTFPSGIRTCEDAIFNLRACLYAKEVLLTDLAVYVYHRHSGSATLSFFKSDEEVYLKILKEFHSFVEESSLPLWGAYANSYYELEMSVVRHIVLDRIYEHPVREVQRVIRADKFREIFGKTEKRYLTKRNQLYLPLVRLGAAGVLACMIRMIEGRR